jgi:Flp pilus assembly protein TadG
MHVRKLWEDRDGVILPYVAVMLIAILGLSALALDASRLMSVQTQLQNAADALALAGAAELDRRPDSIIRAEAAIRNLIANPIVGTGIDKSARISGIDFLQSLPSNDDQPVTATDVTDDPTLAGYVQVTVEPIAIQMIFPVSLAVGRELIKVGAQSVAGYDQVVCNLTPVYVCNPFETSGMSYYQATQQLIAADASSGGRHQLVRLAGAQFNHIGYSAGRIGYVAPATGYFPASACGPGSSTGVPQALAATEVRACFRLSGVNLLPTDDQTAMDGLNTRFDIYANGFNSCRIYPPDQNVRKGFLAIGNANWCNAAAASSTWPISTQSATGLPVDQNMIRQDGTVDPNMVVGNGTWNCAAYWSIAHFSGAGRTAAPPGCTAAATISRYQVYRYEVNFLNDRSRGAETGAPQCAPPGQDYRRVITTAIVNCGSTPVPMQADARGVPVAAFGQFFLTLPANPNTHESPYAEFLGLVKRSDPMSSDIVQLYR